MKNLYKYDLQNRFRFYQFNVVERGSLFDIEILDQDEKKIGNKTCGDENTCYLYARDVMGIPINILPILRPSERDRLKDCPSGLEIIVEDSSTPPPCHKKQRVWGNEWIDVK